MKPLPFDTAAIVAIALFSSIGPAMWMPVHAQSKAEDSGTSGFAVASVRKNVSGSNNLIIEAPPGGRFKATNVPLRQLIQNAYGLQDFQIVGAPAWINNERFDVLAKADADVPKERMPLLVRRLLADRFKLAAHHEERRLPTYALVAARKDGKLGSGLQASSVDCAAVEAASRAQARESRPAPATPRPVPARPTCGTRMAPGYLSAGAVTMQDLAKKLSTLPDVGRFVEDRTGLSGGFDLDLKWTPFSASAAQVTQSGAATDRPANEGPSIFTALQEQLGLKLASAKGPVTVLVIDRVQRPADE